MINSICTPLVWP